MSGDRGQALVLTAALLGLAAVAIVGIGGAAGRLLSEVRDERAGEAAVAAAGTAVADLLAARTRALGRHLDRGEVALIVAEPAAAEAARGAAERLARIHGRAEPTSVRVLAFGLDIEVHVTLAGRTHIALLAAEP